MFLLLKTPKRKKPADEALLNTKKTKIEKSQKHSESINIENTALQSESDGIDTEHLKSEGLVQPGSINLRYM